MKHYAMTWAATAVLLLLPQIGASGGPEALLKIKAKTDGGILRVTRFDNADQCQGADRVARLTRKIPIKKIRIAGGQEVAFKFDYFAMSIEHESVVGGIQSRSTVSEAATILKFDSVAGAQYELDIQVSGSTLRYQLQELAATTGVPRLVALRGYAVAQESGNDVDRDIEMWCPGNVRVPTTAPEIVTSQEAYQTCVDRGVSKESCALNYLSE